MSNLIKDIAFGLGARAYKNGIKCIPALDNDLLESCIAGCKVGESIPYLLSWIHGWQDAKQWAIEDSCKVIAKVVQ